MTKNTLRVKKIAPANALLRETLLTRARVPREDGHGVRSERRENLDASRRVAAPPAHVLDVPQPEVL